MKKNTQWLSLIISLPTANGTARMRIWRALKELGCGVLRDGVYLLPESEHAATCLELQANEVIKAGGTALTVILSSTQEAQDTEFRDLFNRIDEYATLKQDINAFLRTFPLQNVTVSKRSLKRLTRDFTALSAIDFFPSSPRDQVALLLGKATSQFFTTTNPDEPQAARVKIKKLKRADYRKRVWATRKKIWVDRMASAWLIKRFIDPEATFKWLNKPLDCPKSALGFDFDGANFTHVGSLVTFEVLLASFSLEVDFALQRLAEVVHFLDVGGIPVAEATGLELVLNGMRERSANDDELLGEVSRIFDDLYLTYAKEESTND